MVCLIRELTTTTINVHSTERQGVMTPMNTLILAGEQEQSATGTWDWIFTAGMYIGLLIALIGALSTAAALVLARDNEVAAKEFMKMSVMIIPIFATVSAVCWALREDGDAGEKTTPPPTSTTQTPPPTQDAAPDSQTTGADIDWALIGLVGAIIGAVIVLALLILAVRAAWSARQRRRDNREKKRRAELEKLARWSMLDKRHNTVKEAYVTAETDPRTVLERPIIRDVTHKITQDFHTALADATGALERRLDLAYATQAVDTLTHTWSTLWSTAAEIGLPGVSPGDRRRAHNLLTRILDESVDAPEREAARRRLDSIIESSALNSETCDAVATVVTQALELAGLPTLRELTVAQPTDNDTDR